MIKNGALKVARVGGVDVLVHWSWLVLLYVRMNGAGVLAYSTKGWIVAEIGAYVVMTVVYEGMKIWFGRMVGATVSEMYVSFLGRGSDLAVPRRPGAVMIACLGGVAGLLITGGLTGEFFYLAYVRHSWTRDLEIFSLMCLIVNVVLLGWAVIPVYPLNGGKFLRAVLWLFMGERRSLIAACVLGLIGTIGLIAAAVYVQSMWWGISAAVVAVQCIMGFQQAKILGARENLPRRVDVKCVHCGQHPLEQTRITCSCGSKFDPFAGRGQCTACGGTTMVVPCAMCGQRSSIGEWFGSMAGFEVEGVGQNAVEKG